MISRARYRRALTLGAAAVLLAGCAANVQIVRAPFVSPVVLPAPEVFRMNVAVKNYHDTQTSPHLWLWVSSEYFPGAGQGPCRQFEALDVGVLAPGQSWGRADYQLDRSGPCACVKPRCSGHVWLDLHTGPLRAPRISGPNTGLHVSWSTSGSLAEMTVSEF